LIDVQNLQLLGDLCISASGMIPYVIALDIKRKLRSRLRWWAFFIGLIGLAGNFTTLTAAWLGYISLGPEFIYYGNLSRMLLGVSVAVQVADILNISAPRVELYLFW